MFNKNKCPGDDNAYVEFNNESKIFRAIVENVEFFDHPRRLSYVNIAFNQEKCVVMLSFVVSDDQITAKNQLAEFEKLIGKLNNTSFMNKFHLNRVDFFQRQSQKFVSSVTDLSNETSRSKFNTHDHSDHNGNYAF